MRLSQLLLLASLLLSLQVPAQVRRVLFLGNSYTGVNDLPGLVHDLALSAGDTLIYDANTPGGCTLGAPPNAHNSLPASLGKLDDQPWDYVVLQEQSQIPTIAYYRDNTMYPGARQLDDSIHIHNSCSQTLFYLTWGRQNGGQQCAGSYCSPAFADFNEMQDSLETAYLRIANELDAAVSPVGAAWQAVLNDTTLVLHSADQSHPNMSGSYLAACTFYAAIWHKSPIGLSFTAGLDPALALYLQTKADEVVFGQLAHWNLVQPTFSGQFSYAATGLSVNFVDSTQGANQWSWDFGDGNTDTINAPVHTYSQAGTYAVTLIVGNGCATDTLTDSITVTLPVSISPENKPTPLAIYPNPATDWVKWETSEPYGEYRLVDGLGNTHKTGLLQSNTVSVSELPNGLYMFQWYGKEGKWGNQMFVIQR